MSKLFKRGFKAVSEEKVRQDKERENRTKGLWKFFLKKDGDEADITFLTEEPINYYEHTLKTFVNGKERYDSIPCIGEKCKHCKNGDKTSFKSAWLVVDHREVEYTDKENKPQVMSDQIRLFIYGTKIASQLDRVSKKFELMGRTMTMVRLGTGTSTTYTFERGDMNVLSESEIKEALPEALAKEYDGSEDSLYTLLENQILMLAGEDSEDDEEEEAVDNTIVGYEEEEEEDKPVVAKKRFGARKENSVRKTSVKNLIKKK